MLLMGKYKVALTGQMTTRILHPLHVHHDLIIGMIYEVVLTETLKVDRDRQHTLE